MPTLAESIANLPPEVVVEAPKIVEIDTSSPEWIKGRIDHYASLYSVSGRTMNYIVNCESRYNPKAIGDYGNSHGLVQIHLPSHKSITKAQARDVDFALNFLAKNLSKGKGNMWTCYRNM